MDIDEMFDAFWKAYPRKLDKIKARKAFKKLSHIKASGFSLEVRMAAEKLIYVLRLQGNY